MKSVVLTTEYFGPVSSYKLMCAADLTMVEHHENYQKKSFRNRCRVASPNGVVLLSVPLQSGKSSQCPISKVSISYASNWIDEHLQAMLSCYGKSPFYEFYIDEIEEILRREYALLLDMNSALLNFLNQAIDLESNYEQTESFKKSYDKDVTDMRRYDYLNRSKIDIELAKYQQVWEDKLGFMSDLSILDLLFCKGPESVLVLDA